MKTFGAVLAMVICVAVANGSQAVREKEAQEQVVQVEKKLLNTYISGDVTARERYAAEEFVVVDYAGVVATKQEDMQDIKSGTFVMKWFKMKNEKVSFLSPDVALLTYEIAYEATDHGADASSPRSRVAAVYQRRDGVWRCIFTQETKVKEPEDAFSAQALAKEREILETLKHNDWPAFSDLLADDALAIDEDGIVGKKELIDGIKTAGTVFSDYKMENVKVIPQGNGAIVAYRETLVGTQNGKPFTWHIYTHSHWEWRGGKWLMTMFQDSMAKQ
jgi:ketosteroid isomerase-like protein